MVKKQIRITHVSWRDDRPRFQPGAKLRAEGWRGEDLRHGPTDKNGQKIGPWYSEAEAFDWVRRREAEIEARRAELDRAKVMKKKRPPAPSRTSIAVTVGQLLTDWIETNPKFQGADVVDGRRTQKAAAPATVAFYRQKAKALAEYDEMIWSAPVDALTTPICYDLYERLYRDRGLPTAVAIMRTLSAAISWGMKRGKAKLPANPAKSLGMEAPEPRVRALTPAEVRQLIAAADLIGRPEIGDAVALGVWTGQRQADRLQLTDRGLIDGRRVLQQAKTKAIVAIPEAAELAARLKAVQARRKGWTTVPVEIVVDEQRRKPFDRFGYSRVFGEVRAAAAEGIPAEGLTIETADPLIAAHWRLQALPSLADARDQDLRDTAVTWLARAGCTLMEIAQITGHSLQSIQGTLKHYLASHAEMADHAIAKLVAWYEGQTG